MSEQIEIHFNGILSEEHFYKFNQYCRPPWARFIGKWFPWFYLGLMIVEAIGIPEYIASPRFSFDISILLLLLLLPQLTKRQIKKVWQSNKSIQEGFSGVATEENFVCNSSYGESKFPWNVMLKYKEVENIILLYIAINQAFILPSSFFNSEEDWQQFRQLVAERVPKKQ
ncbi:hypothetical protein Sta7437_2549 [Stanieria cyanosphaera PCC 7437]|uniref:YcxB-like C-terminal domain-containing protein n=1 Tax=Stanieria cyanosphaera (strain ATCC 29371 / PCC 7437) TaxID=111780 RepID=K9XVI0_STAC7|nr:YcxB family protein [Stanieria cyanosphaera]AFZ36081.1 hypothetical protein Sta7437_2549 [Stanieria cyanosphaera PCC 7437]